MTWTRDLHYHPYVHYLVPAVGLAPDGSLIFPPCANFLVHVRPLAAFFRAKLLAALRQTPLVRMVAAEVWQQDWVVDCRSVGTGEAALKYLAPYIFRVALSNNRILSAEDGQVTFRYTDRESGEKRTSTVSAETFIERFLAHVLPTGFVKVRQYGLFRLGARRLLHRLRAHLMLARAIARLNPSRTTLVPEEWVRLLATCPSCGAVMHGRPVARAPPGASTGESP